MNVTCNHCNKEFHIRPSFYKKNKTGIFYCCKQCMIDFKSVKKVIVQCNVCNKNISKRITEIGETNFCNQECRIKYKKRVSLNCKCCNKTFELDESYYKKQSNRGQIPQFCGIECRINYQQQEMKTIKCVICDKSFKLNKNKISSNGNCCSIECKNNLFDNYRINTNCNYCGEKIIKNKYSYDKSKTHYCNIECFNNYRTIKKEKYSQIAHYLRNSQEYKTWRNNSLQRDNYRCVLCDSKKELHVHHKTHLIDICEKYHMDLNNIINSTEFNDLNNGITLCSNCHALEHPYIQRDDKGRFCRPNSKPLKS